MRSRPRVLLAVLLLIAVIFALALLVQARSEPPEPSYRGKTLSSWVIDLNGEFTVEQATALDAIGTNAVPLLLKWVAYDTPRLKLVWYSGLNKARSAFHKPRLTGDRRQRLAEEAETALCRFVRETPHIAVECRRLAAQPNLPANVRRRINHLLFIEWTYRGGLTNLASMLVTNSSPSSSKQ